MSARAPVVCLLIILLCWISCAAWAEATSRPVYARPATTATSVLLEGFFEYFDGLDLQEAVAFEGWTAGLDMTFPIRPNMQIRLLVPVRTEADGVFRSDGEDVEIKGWGGTFDFTTVYFEHQVLGTYGEADRLSWFAGYGQRTGVLHTGTPDLYNHDGRSLDVGIRYDRTLARSGSLFLDTQLRWYETSDDLNPGSLIDDRFWLGSVAAAWLGPRLGAWIPGAEIVADATDGYFAASAVPELILSAGPKVDLKLGVPVGLSSDAPDWGTQFRLTVSF
jgi:hypothetical protein